MATSVPGNIRPWQHLPPLSTRSEISKNLKTPRFYSPWTEWRIGPGSDPAGASPCPRFLPRVEMRNDHDVRVSSWQLPHCFHTLSSPA